MPEKKHIIDKMTFNLEKRKEAAEALLQMKTILEKKEERDCHHHHHRMEQDKQHCTTTTTTTRTDSYIHKHQEEQSQECLNNQILRRNGADLLAMSINEINIVMTLHDRNDEHTNHFPKFNNPTYNHQIITRRDAILDVMKKTFKTKQAARLERKLRRRNAINLFKSSQSF
eukprot:97536_1